MPEKGIAEVGRALREQYEKGLAAFQKNNLDYAIALFEGILRQEPSFFDCRQALHAAQIRRAGTKGGGFFKRMLGTASNSPLIAKAQLELRSNPIEAIHTAEQVLANDPQSAAAHRIIADAALTADYPRTAVLSLEAAYRISPDRDGALRLAQALSRAGRMAKADTVLSELSQAFPNDPEIAQALKNIAAKRTLTEGGYEALEDGSGSYRDVLRNKEEAVSLEQEKREVKTDDVATRLIAENELRLAKEPKNLRLLRSTAELYAQKGQFDEALAAYQRIIDSEGMSEPTLERAITETTLRKYDAALAALDPQAADYEEQKARLEAERQTYELERGRKLAEQYPNDLQLRFDLGELYFRAGKLTEAIQEFQKAQANPHRRIAALHYLGQCFARRGIHDLAVRTLQTALREKAVFDDEKKELLYSLGLALEKMGKPDEAVEQYKLIYEVDIGYKDVAARVDAYYANRG